MRASEQVNLLVVGRDAGQDLLQQRSPRHNRRAARCEDRSISGSRNCLSNLFEAFRDALAVAAIVVDRICGYTRFATILR